MKKLILIAILLASNWNAFGQGKVYVPQTIQNLTIPPGGLLNVTGATLTGFPAGGPGAVNSVFGRTGAVVSATGDYTFAQIGSTPTTLAGYGITDPVLLSTGSYANPTWLTSLAWGKITGAPAFLTANQTITLSGDVTGSGTTSIVTTVAAKIPTGGAANQVLTKNSATNYDVSWQTPAAGGGAVTSVFTRTGAVVAQAGDYAAFYEPIGGAETLPSETAATPPITFSAPGTLLTTPTAGAMEHDANVMYYTHSASERGAVTAVQWIKQTSAYTLVSQTAAQKLFNSTPNGQITVAAGLYRFHCQFSLSALTGTSGFGFALAGTAVMNATWYSAGAKGSSAAVAGQQTFNQGSLANTALVTTSASPNGFVDIEGQIIVTTGGTIQPQVSLPVAAAAVVGVDTIFEIWPIGSPTAVSVGNWN